MENEEVKNLENENASSFAENKEQQQEAINMAMKFGENATEEDVENVSKKMDKMKKGALAKVWDKVQELWAAFKSPDTPLSTKSIIIGSLIYMVTPIDIIPDIIPGLGLLDDAFIIGLVFTQVMKLNKTSERINADAANKELGYVYADSAKISAYGNFVNKMYSKDKHTKNEQREKGNMHQNTFISPCRQFFYFFFYYINHFYKLCVAFAGRVFESPVFA
ncbi:YkvA family protein [uncultured Treponema sp.]|uniref:YkvA family protein n=1 Tax=uncultured Treponema sp. TaxID=162155 RepID=UPI002592628D|nr:DUF1232 domain-containing protein [uncultured Treponema sp.]